MLLSMLGPNVFAHDIEVENADGVMIYYNYINDGTELEVTYRGPRYNEYAEYSDIVDIPEEVTYMNTTRRVTSIGNSAFRLSGLISVRIPNSVTNIGNYAFQNCSYLSSVTIGNSVTFIGNQAFEDCSSLTSVHISDLEAWCKIKFQGSNPLWYAHHLYMNGTEIKDLVIPNSVTAIGDYSFHGCKGLTSITIPNSVTSIGNYAFYGCIGITSLTIPNSVKSIGENAFASCSGLTSVTIGNSVTSIGDCTFSGCSGLTSITIPNSVTSIGDYTFSGCSGLTSITIPNSVTSIGYYAFSGCGLTSITIPNSVTSIGHNAFNSCSNLSSITIPNSVTSIADQVFYGCSGLTFITIPNSVTSIGNYAFYGCRGLTSVVFPNSVTSIGECAFQNCNKIESIALPEKIGYIQKYTFWGCSSLKSITIPVSVNIIYQGAFVNCTSLEFINVLPTTPPLIYDDSFSDFTVPVNVPSGCAGAYREAQGWRNFTTINDGNVYYKLAITTGQHGKATYDGVDVKNATQTFDIKEGNDAAITITADADYQIATVTVNGEDALGSIANGVLTLSNITANKTIKVTFNRSSDHTTITLANAMQTYCPLDDVDFSKVTGLKAYTATGFDHGTLTVSRVLNAPAGTGLLLQGETGTYNVPYASTTGYYINLLHGLTEDTWVEPTDGNQTNFVLGKKNNVLTFYQLSSAGTIAAGKAYLQLPTSVVNEAWGSRVMRIIADDETTGIREVYDLTNGIDAMDADAVYDLCGRKVTGARKGLYIVNGQKVFIR